MIGQTQLQVRDGDAGSTVVLANAAPALDGTLRRLMRAWWTHWVHYASATYPWR
jgi:hypothetical protein